MKVRKFNSKTQGGLCPCAFLSDKISGIRGDVAPSVGNPTRGTCQRQGFLAKMLRPPWGGLRVLLNTVTKHQTVYVFIPVFICVFSRGDGIC